MHPDWPGTHYIKQAALKFMILLPPPNFPVLGLQVCAATSGLGAYSLANCFIEVIHISLHFVHTVRLYFDCTVAKT